MPAAFPYLLYSKAEQLCLVTRNTVTVNFDTILPPLDRTVKKVKLLAPKPKSETLPPRLNLKNISLTAKVLCHQLRKQISKKDFVNVKGSRSNDHIFGHTCETNVGRRPYLMILNTGNICPGFSWEEERVTDKDISRCVRDFKIVKKLKNNSTNKSNSKNKKTENKNWEKCLDRQQITIWKKPMDYKAGMFEYRVFGRFHDITAREFYNTQVDDAYRMEWDGYSLKLNTMDKDPLSGTEIIHWISKFPYPMKCRDYVFARRHKILPKSKAMVVVSRACSHPWCPESSSYVRVSRYTSKMIIKPHRTFDELGCDYVLTYHDDPGVSPYCMNVVATAAIPEFVKKLHKATIQKNTQ